MPEDTKTYEIWQDIHGKNQICLGSVPAHSIITTFLDLHSLVIMGEITCCGSDMPDYLKDAFINRQYLNLKISDHEHTYRGRFYLSSYDSFSNHCVFRSTGEVVYEIAENIGQNHNSCA
ncbi:hypothetical protein [Kordiimonas sp. SCSIO 12610]|uniref:hypothetical protein n=1 Tax=Kordiimonas sp. SCSIO 12610 TaxID=2829597 RepID=UPI00210B8F71|nr:hypothetical protein [Kordiimonas sp. SCSIO 12610]UTW55181.1 hypothetical protein KFF44_15460 [Kordiimonas sp. SCSIO 12610]